jgi:PIN like domain
VRFFLDHNLSPRLIHTIAAILPEHDYCCARDEQLTNVDDIPLFAELCRRGFDTLITRDRQQLVDASERGALIGSGLHWLGVREPKVGGLIGLALDSAAITIGLTLVLPDLGAVQRAYRFQAVPHQKDQRAKPIPLQL